MKRMRSIGALMVVLALVLSLGSVSAFAATPAAPDAEEATVETKSIAATNITLSGVYTVVADRSRTVFGDDIQIVCYNTNTLHHNDVRMKDANGNVIWEEYGAIDTNGSRIFYCGADVYTIEVRIGAKNIVGDMAPKVGSCNVFF